MNILDMVLDLVDIDFFSHPSGETRGNVEIFRINMSSSTKTDKRKKDIFTFGKGHSQELEYPLSDKKCI